MRVMTKPLTSSAVLLTAKSLGWSRVFNTWNIKRSKLKLPGNHIRARSVSFTHREGDDVASNQQRSVVGNKAVGLVTRLRQHDAKVDPGRRMANVDKVATAPVALAEALLAV
jgi:hypothetical protein